MILFVACSKEAPEAGGSAKGKTLNGPPLVYTVNYPLKYFADRIAEDHAKVVFPAMDGDPAYWEPDPKAISAFQKADLILLNGAAYAKWVDKATLSESRMVNTSRKFKDQYVKLHDAVTHSHGPEGKHEHTGVAFTTWLDFSLAVEQARAILEALVKLMPDRKDLLEKNFDALEQDLLQIDQKILDLVANKTGTPLVMSHPVYQYMEQRYNLNAMSVHWEPDQTPDEAMWRELKTLLADHPAKWMIWEDAPEDGVMEKLKELGVESAVFCPCGNAPEQGDFMSVMQQNLKNLERVFPR
jgi:zinc transport system substrate-binding protein